jgi:hypothetical protein
MLWLENAEHALAMDQISSKSLEAVDGHKGLAEGRLLHSCGVWLISQW